MFAIRPHKGVHVLGIDILNVHPNTADFCVSESLYI